MDAYMEQYGALGTPCALLAVKTHGKTYVVPYGSRYGITCVNHSYTSEKPSHRMHRNRVSYIYCIMLQMKD